MMVGMRPGIGVVMGVLGSVLWCVHGVSSRKPVASPYAARRRRQLGTKRGVARA